MCILTELDKFMSSSFRNLWIEDEFLTIYVRKGFHRYGDKCIDTLDIANILDSPFKGQGHFKAFMAKAESLGLPVYVECINNPNLVDMLAKHGYEIMPNNHSTHAIKFPQETIC